VINMYSTGGRAFKQLLITDDIAIGGSGLLEPEQGE